MSGGNDSFTNLLSGGWNNPYAGSSSNPNEFGFSSEEAYQQHQAMQYWNESQQNDLTSNFQNLQFSQNSQQSQTKTYQVPETPIPPQNEKVVENVRQKSPKTLYKTSKTMLKK